GNGGGAMERGRELVSGPDTAGRKRPALPQYDHTPGQQQRYPGDLHHSIQINAPMYLRGAAVTVSDGLSSATPSGVVTVECPIILGGNQEFSDDQFHLEFDGGINLNGHNLTFNAIGNNGAHIIVSSGIS